MTDLETANPSEIAISNFTKQTEEIKSDSDDKEQDVDDEKSLAFEK